MLAFYQFRQTQRLNKLKKINDTIKSVFELKKSAAELQNIIDNTDDITSHSDIFKNIHLFTESAISILNSPKLKTAEIYYAEQALLKNQLEFDLFSMDISARIQFNNECNKI